MSNLQNLSDGMAAAVKQAGSGLVRVSARRRLGASGIVWSEDGIVITASHVVRRDSDIKVGLPDGNTVAATVVGRDNTTDLAVLRLEASDLSPISQANEEAIAVGNIVMALGRPRNSVQATLGIVSALGESWRTSAGGEIDRYLRTDVLMYPGFSGGPLVNVSGEMLGLNSSALGRGVSLAIPNATLSRVISSIVSYGKVRRGYLGISTQAVRLPASIREELGQDTGLLIASVEADSPAEQGGLLLGDTIVALAGVPVHMHDDLISMLHGDRVGQATSIRVLRGGALQDIEVVIGERT